MINYGYCLHFILGIRIKGWLFQEAFINSMGHLELNLFRKSLPYPLATLDFSL
jgi:hypothetical protein